VNSGSFPETGWSQLKRSIFPPGKPSYLKLSPG